MSEIEVQETRTLADSQAQLVTLLDELYQMAEVDSDAESMALEAYERVQEIQAFIAHQNETMARLVEMLDTAVAAADRESAIRELYAERGMEMAKFDMAKKLVAQFGAKQDYILLALDWLTGDVGAEVGSLGEMVAELLEDLGASVESDSL